MQHSVAHKKSQHDEQMRKGFSLSSAPGKVGAENTSPKISGGKREVIDETFKGKAAFKDTEQGEITE